MISYMGEISESIIESADLSGKRAGLFRRFASMSTAEKKQAWRKLPKWKRALAFISAPALFPFASVPSPAKINAAMLIAKRQVKALRGVDDVELMGGMIKNWVKKIKSMSPAQKKAAWKKMPFWKKALVIAAAPAIVATAAASLPVLLPTAAAVATAAASAKLTKKATLALAKKVKAARAARAVSKADRNQATVQAIEQTSADTPSASIPSSAQAAKALLLPFPLAIFS